MYSVSISFTVVEKEAGDFSLEVAWIEAEVTAEEPATTNSAGALAGGPAGDLIRLAIQRGVPLFNQGQPEACKAVYEVAATALLSLPWDGLSTQSRLQLTEALAQAAKDGVVATQAWTLRRALDSTLDNLSKSGQE